MKKVIISSLFCNWDFRICDCEFEIARQNELWDIHSQLWGKKSEMWDVNTQLWC